MRRTPVTMDGLTQFDHLPAAEAVARAWLEPGRNPAWHAKRRRDVKKAMPLLARALERLREAEFNDAVNDRASDVGAPGKRVPYRVPCNVCKQPILRTPADGQWIIKKGPQPREPRGIHLECDPDRLTI